MGTAPTVPFSDQQKTHKPDAECEAPSKTRTENRPGQERSPESGLQQLLSEAKQQFWEGRLITPEGDNALETCRKLLTLDPNNSDAATGIASIKKEIMHLAVEAGDRGDWELSKQYLEVILSIDPTDQVTQQAHENLKHEAAVDTLQSLLVQRENVLTGDSQPKHRSDSPSQIGPRPVAFSATFGLVLFLGGGFLVHQKYEQAAFRTPYIAATSTKPLQSTGKLKQMQAEVSRLLQLKATHMQRAVAAQGERDWVTARAELEQMLAIDSEDEAARAALANVVEAEALAAEIDRLLQLAGEQFNAGRLVAPEGDNALASYRAILEREPQHAEVLAGIEQIKAVYMERALAAQGERDWITARSELEVVLTIDPADEGGQAMLAEVVQAQEVAAEINRLSQLAAEQFAQGRMISPEGDNALASYRSILNHEPQHAEALAGIEEIKAVYMERAVVAQGERNWVVARGELEQVLAIDDTDEAAQAVLAEVVQEQEVEAEIDRLLQLATERFVQGRLTSPDGENALTSYREILNYEPQHAEALAGIEQIKAVYMESALAAQSERDWVTARAELEQMLAIDSEDEAARAALANVVEAEALEAEVARLLQLAAEQFAQGRMISPEGDNALASYRAILNHEPQHAEALVGIEQIKAAHMQRAVAAQGERDWVTARAELEQMLAIDSEDEAARAALANVVEAEALEAEINRLLQLAGEQFNAGRLVAPEGDNALTSYRAILNHEPQHAEAIAGIERIKAVYIESAVSAQREEDWATAQGEWEQVLAIDGEDDQARGMLAEVVRAQVAAEIDRLLQLAGEQFNAGRLVAPEGDNALASYRAILEREPQHAEVLAGIEQIKAVYMERALAAQGERDWVTARADLEQVLAIDSEDEAARTGLASVVEAEALEAEVARLLQLATEQFAHDQLTSPEGDNALASYRAILNHEPQHVKALAGIEQIKAVYMERVRSELEAVLAIDGEDEAAEAALVEVLQAGQEQKPTFEMIGGDSSQPENEVGENTVQSDSTPALEDFTGQAVRAIPEDSDVLSEIEELLSRE